MTDQQKPISPALYDDQYYLEDNEGCQEYSQGLDAHIHEKFKRVLDLCPIKQGDRVLDLGCGRGEMLYYCAKRGASAVGLDYSEAAVRICRQMLAQLPSDSSGKIQAFVSNIEDYQSTEKFDYIFIIEVLEHMWDWQVESSLAKIRSILKPDGHLIITTPNYLYQSFLQPVKMTIDLPFRFLKFLFRIPRGKFKPKSWEDFFQTALKVKVSRGSKNEKMHCNVMTPGRLKKLLKDFDAKIYCEDPSLHPLSLLLRHWMGRQIVVVAKLKSGV